MLLEQGSTILIKQICFKNVVRLYLLTVTLFIFVNDKLSRIVDTAFDWLLKFKNNLTTNQIKIRPYSSFFDKQQATAKKDI